MTVSDKLLIFLFVAAIWLPTLDLVFKLDPNPVPVRSVVPFPPLPRDVRSTAKFPGQLMWYARNNTGFRGSLVRLHGRFKRDVLGVSPSPSVALGRDGWLFLRSEQVLDDARGVAPMDEDLLERWGKVLQERHDWLAKRGIRYLVVVTPNKETIYPEFLPAWAGKTGPHHRMDQWLEHVSSRSSVEVLDLRPALLEHKGRSRLYHLTDTHWNGIGGYYGYLPIANALKRWFPDVTPLSRDAFTVNRTVSPGGDLARMIGLKNDYREELLSLENPDRTARLPDGGVPPWEPLDVQGIPVMKTRSNRGEIPRAVVVRDSFGEMLIPYLSEHFAQAVWVWSYDLPVQTILDHRPDVVLQQIVERKLGVLEPVNPPEVATDGDQDGPLR